MQFRSSNLQTCMAIECLERAMAAPGAPAELFLERAAHWRRKLELAYSDTEAALVCGECETVASDGTAADGRLTVELTGELLGLSAGLAELIEQAREVHFRITNCSGGCVRSAIAILNASAGKTVSAHGAGLVASSAALVLALADGKRTLDSNGLILIHQPKLLLLAESGRLRSAAEELDRLTATIIRKLIVRTRQPARRVWQWFHDGDSYFNAERALSCGLIDEVSES